MKSRFRILLTVALCLWTCALAYGQEKEPALVDVKGRRAFNVKLANGEDGVALVGDVVAYHNGAIMQCDSALRYSDNRLECYGNVLINKDSTYIYGDRVDYNGDTNTAQVFSPLIKMIDGDAILYTYNFLFNTLDNIGEYYGGGTITQKDMILESERGYYFADTKDAVCAGKAELRDSTYQIKSDSIGYNMDTEIATFFMQTYIWNDKGEILSAEEGYYYTQDERYLFTSNAYIVTDIREVWADDIDYMATPEDIVMRRNIQIRDEEQKMLAFGDYGQYWGDTGNAMMTENPSLVSFYEQPDTVYMRSDSMFMYIVDSTSIYHSKYVDGQKETASNDDDEEELGAIAPVVSTPPANPVVLTETPQTETLPEVLEPTEESNLSMSDDDTMPLDTLSVAERPPLPDEMSPQEEGADENPELSPEEANPEMVRAAPTAEDKKESRRARKEARKKKKDARERVDEVVIADTTSIGSVAETMSDSPVTGSSSEEMSAEWGSEAAFTDSENAESTEDTDLESSTVQSDETTDAASPVVPTEEPEEDEEERVFIFFRDVKIFRSDAQAVCDSLIAFSIDSTAHMYINPVMWSSENQIKSDVVDIFTKNEKIDKAVFTGGNPIMISEIDRNHYNQVTGKVIEALFNGNDIYRVDANANAQTYYYFQDEGTRDLQGYLVVESSDISFFITDREVVKITYRGNPVYSVYPMDKIPGSQSQRMSNFAWEPERKPNQKDVFDREIRPSQREEYESMETPVFPLTDKIHEWRQSLIESKQWKDRTDPVTQGALDYIATLKSAQ